MTLPDEKKAATEFDQWALSGRAESMAEGHKGALFQAIDAWDFNAQHACLDIGCGNGYFGLRMLGAGAKLVIGIDQGETTSAKELLGFGLQF